MKSKNYFKGLSVGLLLGVALVSSPSSAEEGSGGVDWTRRVVTATGKGAPNLRAANIAQARLGAEKAAKLDALRNILAALKGVELRSGESVGAVIEANSTVRAKIQGVVKNFQVVKTRYFSDGGVEVDVEMKLDGELTATLLPKEAAAAGKCDGSTTGLVIDARSLTLVPALAPRVLDVEGKELLSSSTLSPAAARDNGTAAYVKSIDEAKSSSRVGCAPLVVTASAAKGSDLVVAADTAKQIRTASGKNPFLTEGRVLIVVN